jgi:hypothetical protein
MLTFMLIPGVLPSVGRAVGVLSGHPELNILVGFSSLSPKAQADLKARMEFWIAGNNGPKKWFHGFTSQEKYRHLFVFKHKSDRFYGFLCHPRPKTEPRFQLCVLTIHAKKKEWETDYSELDRVNEWRTSPAATMAISTIYPEYGKEASRWNN